jgi:hypothetical protein
MSPSFAIMSLIYFQFFFNLSQHLHFCQVFTFLLLNPCAIANLVFEVYFEAGYPNHGFSDPLKLMSFFDLRRFLDFYALFGALL